MKAKWVIIPICLVIFAGCTSKAPIATHKSAISSASASAQAEASPTVSMPFSAEQRGSSLGNIVNYGFMVSDQEWLYYANPADQQSLYKMRHDGTQKQKLSDDRPNDLNLIGDWLVYTNQREEEQGFLTKIRTNGTQRVVLLNHFCGYVQATAQAIYYVDYEEEQGTLGDGRIFRMNWDGTNVRQVVQEYAEDFYVLGSSMYFVSLSDQAQLMKAEHDGTGKTVVTTDMVSFLNYDQGRFYYVNSSDGKWHVYSVKPDGSDRRKVNDEYTVALNVQGGSLYYSGGSATQSQFVTMKTTGTQRRILNTDVPVATIILGEKIYYWNDTSRSTIIQMQLDGSQRKELL